MDRTAIQNSPVPASHTDFLTFRWTAWLTISYQMLDIHMPLPNSCILTIFYKLGPCLQKDRKVWKEASVFTLPGCLPYLTRESWSFTHWLCLWYIYKTCFTSWDPKQCKAWFPDACRSMGCRKSLVHFDIVVIFYSTSILQQYSYTSCIRKTRAAWLLSKYCF